MTNEEIVASYQQHGTLAGLAKDLGVSTWKAKKALEAAGGQPNTPILTGGGKKINKTCPPFVDSPEWYRSAYQEYKCGMPTMAAAAGRSVGFIAGKLRAFGIQTRSISEATRTLDRARVLSLYREKGTLEAVAQELGCSVQGVKNVLEELGEPIRSTSQIFSGSGNPFAGQTHPAHIVDFCREIGTYHGLKFWADNPEYVEVVREKQKTLWADLTRRAADSRRISLLRKAGKCNSHRGEMSTRFGQIKFDSSYEVGLIEWCESDLRVVGLDRDFMLVEYEHEGARYFIPDFRVWLANGDFLVVEVKSKWLQLQEKEQAKIKAGMAVFESKFVVIDNDLRNLESAIESTYSTVEFDFVNLRIAEVDGKYEEFYRKYHYLGRSERHGPTLGAYLGDQLVVAATIAGITRAEIATRLELSTDEVRELVRFCIHPRYHKKNLATWFMARLIKWYRADNPDVAMLVSFADTTQGHEGTIYAASNWKNDGLTSKSYHYVDAAGKEFHKKTIYEAAVRDGLKEAEYVLTKGLRKVAHKPKIRFLYRLDGK